MGGYTIGLDLGGTNLRAAAIDQSGKILDKLTGTVGFSAGREAVVHDMVSVIAELRSRFGVEGLAGIGIGVPGFILLREGVIRNSNNLPYLENFPLRDEIERELKTWVILENDANAAALGEKWMGTGKGVEDLTLLTLGTGIGGGIISAGRVLRGGLGMAGELGHVTVYPDGNPCGCGNRGCLKKHASASAVTAMARLLNLGENLTSRDVYEMARQGDPKALRIWSQVGEALGIAMALMVNTFNFPLYLLSGGMLPAWEFFAPPMLETVRWRSFTYRNTNTRIEQAALGNQAGLFGAAYLPWIEQRTARTAHGPNQ